MMLRPFAVICARTDCTIRNTVHTSIGGSRVRVRVSNVFGTAPLPVAHATVALGSTKASAAVAPGTLRQVTFGGAASVTIPAGHDVVSDPVSLRVPADADPVVTAPATSLTVTPGTATVGPGTRLSVDADFVLPSGTTLRDVRMTLDRSRLPTGWTVSGSNRTARYLPARTPLRDQWTVTVAPDQPSGSVDVPVVVTYANPGGDSARPIHVEAIMRVTIPLHGAVFVSDLPFLRQTNGWGPVERDQSNGEAGAGDGHPLTVNGITYAKGLGMNSPAQVDLDVEGRCTSFDAEVGIDDEVTRPGTVTFIVQGDGRQLAGTAEIGSGHGPVAIHADLTGVHTLSLMVGEASNGNTFDHADWGLGKLTCND